MSLIKINSKIGEVKLTEAAVTGNQYTGKNN